MNDEKTNIYKEAAGLCKIAVFEYDVRNDSFRFDDLLPQILQHKIPKKNLRESLLKARFVHPKDRQNFQHQVSRVFEKTVRNTPSQDFAVEFRGHISGRNYIWLHLAYRVHYEGGCAQKVIGFLKNINSERQKQQQMQSMTEHDPMTGLYSKTHSEYLVNQAIAVPMTLNALLVIDMDNFKQVNDKLGHLIGDAVILDMAMHLKTLFRQTDILGHIGGDEFMVLMRNIVTPEIVHQKCRALRDALRKTYTHNGEEVKVSASIGIALSPLHGTDYKTLFTHADTALYQCKRLGKDTQVLYATVFVGHRAEDDNSDDSSSQELRQLLQQPKEYIFNMVYNSRDTSIAVQILLEVFAKYFRVHRAYIFWHIDGPYWPKQLFDYVRGDFKPAAIAHDAPVRKHIRQRYKTTDKGRCSECADTTKLPESARREFERRQIRSYLEYAVMDGVNFMGTVGFDDCKKARVWTEEEHNVLRAFADILRRFLFGQIYFESKKRNGRWGL